MKTLILEDDPNLLLLWEEVFAEKGHVCICTSTVSEAQIHVASTEFDLVVLDLGLQGGSGLDMLQGVDRYIGSSPILVVTGSAAYRNGELFDMSPAVRAVLRKPVDIEDMMEVAEYLGMDQTTMPENLITQLPIELRRQ